MSDELGKRVRLVLDHIASGIFDPDEIGNLIRDLVWELRRRTK